MSQQAVTKVSVLESDHINYLTIIDENGNEQVIETTDSHPFWVVTDDPDLERAARENVGGFYHENVEPGLNGYWVEAKDLRSGDVFLGVNGERSTLVDTERVEFSDKIRVYNFTVDGNHNYFVIAETGEYGQTSILVHNTVKCVKGMSNWFEIKNFFKTKTKTKGLPTIDKTGKTHLSDFPDSIPKNWSREEISDAIDTMKESIRVREEEVEFFFKQRGFRDKGHLERIALEEDFLFKLRKRLEELGGELP